MAKGNRSTRRNARGTGENSGAGAARDVAADHEEAQNVENAANVNAAAENVNVAVAAGAAAGAAGAPVGLEAVLGMLAQVLARLPATAPAQVVPPPVVNVEQVVEDADMVHGPRIPSYLKVMDHMQKLGTKFFAGGSKPIEADQWISRLTRNFDSIRCPEAYKKDIAVHYLEGDAHMWWQGIAGRFGMRNFTWDRFCDEFRSKYFPPEAFDKLEGAFLDLRQGTMTVREYEAEFNSLKKYAGRELDEEKVQVRRFMRGLRVELRNRCQIRSYATVSELVEKAAQQEAGMLEEVKLMGNELQVQLGNVAGKNKKWVKNAPSGKSSAKRSVCSTCGKMHVGMCRSASGACHRCGSLNHKVRDCPEEDQRAKNSGKDAGDRLCYNCGEVGHFKNQCPKLGQQAGKRASDGPFPPAKRQAIMPRVYTIGDETMDPSTPRPITGKP